MKKKLIILLVLVLTIAVIFEKSDFVPEAEDMSDFFGFPVIHCSE